MAFWRTRQAQQDPHKGLTGTAGWLDMMAGGGDNGEVLAIRRDDGLLAAVIPLLRQTAALGGPLPGRKVRPVLRVCGGDFVEEGLCQEDIEAAWRVLLDRHPEVDAILMDHVQVGRRLDLLVAGCGRHGACFLHRLHAEMPHYRLVLPPTWEVFQQVRSPESLKKIDRRERALAREAGGATRLVEIRRMEDAEPYASDINRLMGTSWQARHLGHSLDVGGMRPVAERGWLRSFLLMAADQPAAFVFGYQGEGVFVYEQIGYDQRFAKHSPGTLLLYRLIRRLYEDDTPQCVDFGEGEAEYKQVLANDVIRVQSVMAVRRCLSLRVRFAAALAHSRGNRLGRLILEKVGIKRWLVRKLKSGAWRHGKD